MKQKVLFYLIFLILLSSLINAQSLKQGHISRGVLQLTEWDFAVNGVINLNGEWEFYWLKLYQPRDFESLIPAGQGFISLPSVWNHSQYQGKKLTGQGYATYRLTLYLKDTNQELALKIPYLFTSYKLWINQNLAAENGRVSHKKSLSRPQYLPQTAAFKPDSKKVIITLQIANFFHSKGGIRFPIYLGTKKQIQKMKYNALAGDLFIFGCLFIIAVYHFGLFFMRRNDKSLLLFGIICICYAIRTILTGEVFFTQNFSQFNWFLQVRLEFFCAFLTAPLFMKFIDFQFRKEFSKKIVRLVQIIGYSICLAVLFTPSLLFTQFALFVSILGVLVGSYALIKLTYLAIRKNVFAILFIIGFSVFIITLAYDSLVVSDLIKSGFILPYGILVAIIFQALVLSIRFSFTFNKVELLTKNLAQNVTELDDLNKNLEKKVKERIKDLHEINLQLEDKNSQIMRSLHYASSIQISILPNLEAIRKHCRDVFVIWKPKDIVGGDLYWFKEMGSDFLIGLIDCTGHGVPGAFMTMITNSVLNHITSAICQDNPALILHELNNLMRITLNQNTKYNLSNDGLDIALGYYAHKKKKIIFSSARIPIFYTHDQQIYEINGDKQSIGYIKSRENFLYTNHELDITGEISFYFISDGYLHQLGGEKNFPFGKKRFKTILQSINNLSFADQQQILKKNMDQYQGDLPQIDDVSILGFKLG